MAKPPPVTCQVRGMSRVPISSPGHRETQWSVKASFHSNPQLRFPGNQDPQNWVAVGTQSSLGTVNSIFPLNQSQRCPWAGRGDGPVWWHVREEGATAWLQDSGASLNSQLQVASPASRRCLAECSKKSHSMG